MSRCFPFPPPGYENKARPNDLNLIIKEKDKHKKHKKDKDKKERSERKDKERAEGKHKEGKDRKQKKHKDKKEKKKEKQKSSEENKIVEPPSLNQNGEKPNPYNKLGNGAHDDRNLVEFGKRVGNGDGAMDDKRRFLEEKKFVNLNQNSEKLGPGNKSGDGAHGLGGMGKEFSNGDKKDVIRKSSEDEKKIVGPHLENRTGERPGPYNNPSDVGRNHIISVDMGKRVTINGDKKDVIRKSSEDEKKIVGPHLENRTGERPGPYNNPGDVGRNHIISVDMGKRVRNDEEATDRKDKRQKPSDEKKFARPPENQNCVTPDPDNRNSVVMGNRVGYDDGATEKADNMKEKHKPYGDKTIAGPSEIRNSVDPEMYKKLGSGAHEHSVLVEMGKRVRADDGATYNRCPSIRSDGQSLGVDAKCSGNNWVGNFSGEKRIKVESSPCQANSVEKKKEGKEKTKHGNIVGEVDGLNNKNRDKKKKEDKKRKKEDKLKRKEMKIKKRESDGNLLDLSANKPVNLLKESWGEQGKLPELKEQSILNGFLHVFSEENGTLPDNTTNSAAISSHQVGQNGNGSHRPCHKNTAIPLAVEKQQALIANQVVNGSKLMSPESSIMNTWNSEPGLTANNSSAEPLKDCTKNHNVGNGSHVVNGSKLMSPESSIMNIWNSEPGPTANNSSPEPLRDCTKNHNVGNGSHVQNGRRNDNKEPGVNGGLKGNKVISQRPSIKKDRPPHPDFKYLNEILSVPKTEPPLLIDNDEEWLFGCKDAKRVKIGSSMVECTERVWSNAIRLEAADVIAMPFVNIF